MNEELTKEQEASLEKKRASLVKILECLDSLEKSKEWETLKELVFSKELAKIERQLYLESLEQEINTKKIYILQGERNFAKRFVDVERFAEYHKSQLKEINRLLKT